MIGDGPSAAEIREQLDRILTSAPFRTSKRCSDLLRHVVNEACEGHQDFLKERTLGVAVFERHPEYDTNQDPVVRNTAGQVRKRLAQYYCELGRDRELRIDLPAGGYVPQIHTPAERTGSMATPVEKLEPLAVESTADVAIPGPARGERGRLEFLRGWRAAGVAIAALLVATGAWWAANRPAKTSVDLFWAPLLQQTGPVVLVVGQGHSYKLKGDWDRLFESEAETQQTTLAPTGQIPLSDLVPTWDRTIGISDAQTLVRVTALFARFGREVEFRGGRTTSLRDLRGRSSVLIGAFNNSWTLSLTGELRFYFEDDAKSKSFLVRDRANPENRAWAVSAEQTGMGDYEDYAIVSRVFNPTTEDAVVVAAGIKGGGTAAAGEFLTHPEYLERALSRAPTRWDRGNAQFVLKTRLLGGTTGPPEVVAAHFW